ncbi:MAG: LOG family protein [Bacteroidaceae bacterium]|nr:LOG family protein [Bacteroidaceae bacterium]
MITLPDYHVLEKAVGYLKEVPYDVTPQSLYNALSLYDTLIADPTSPPEECYDLKVYQHFIDNGKHARKEAEQLGRSLHDFAIYKEMNKYLKQFNPLTVVGVMGGHQLKRTDATFKEIVLLSKRLTELGSLMVSGGGPGAMEATHLGAWLAGRTNEEVDEALKMLLTAPTFHDEGWITTALEVMRQFPQTKYHSLGIPTWLYGHEPSTPFATEIAKFFVNSVREDTILTVAYGGIIYTPGSAGTMQEVFQEAVQNHYMSFELSSPMIFLGKKFWTEEQPVYPFLQQLISMGKYRNLLLSLTDSDDEVVETLMDFRKNARMKS